MLLPSKLNHSSRLQSIVERPRLMDTLKNAHQYPIVLVHAPAGYGKTTLMSQWAMTQKNIGWFSLDENDNKSARFIAYFSAALSQAAYNETPQTINPQRYDNLVAHLNQLLFDINPVKEHFYLLLDDFHLIDNEEILEGIRFWIKNQPHNMTLILVSRTVPSLNIASLRIKEWLLEINIEQLPFTYDESFKFFEQSSKEQQSQHDIIALCNATEGWPTALQLAKLYIKQHECSFQQATDYIERLNNHHITEYLNEEVFKNIDADTQKFILYCSTLRSMNEMIINRITPTHINATQRIDSLAKQGLFIQQITNNTDNQQWWRFHPLFASFLTSQQLNYLSQDELNTIHQIAAQAWLELGYTTESLYHATQLTDLSFLLSLLQDKAWELFHQGELSLVEECLNYIPYNLLASHPKLILLQAWLAQSQHRHGQVGQMINRFQLESKRLNISISKEVQAEFDALKAQVAINQGDDKTALQLASQSLKHLKKDFFYAKIVATSIIGEAYHCQGELELALKMLKRAERMALQYHANHSVLWSLLQQAEILVAQGFLQSAYDLLDKANSFVEKFHLQKIPMYEFLLRLKSQILIEWYQLDKAESMANAGLSVLQKEQDQLQCLVLLARIAIIRGEIDNASRILEQCDQLTNTYTYHYDWITNTNRVKLLLWQQTNDHQAVHSWLTQADHPLHENNHFTHAQSRNIGKAHLLLGEFNEAESVFNRLINNASQNEFVNELLKDLLQRNQIYQATNRQQLAQKDLIKALTLSKQSNSISPFIIEGESMAQQLRQLLQLNVLDEMLAYKAQFILRQINQLLRHQVAHFDESFVKKLLNNPEVPELLKISPLTQREWQVLGLIYSGYSNDQIASELQVAITTIKTHIRNLYQKINVVNRQESIAYTRELLRLMGYIR